MTRRTFAEALKALSDYLNDPASDFTHAGRARLLARLESDVLGYISETQEHDPRSEATTMMVLHDLMENNDKTPRDVLADYGLLDG